MEPGTGDLLDTHAGLYALLDKYSLPHGSIFINEYGSPSQQTPVFSAWYIAQLERIDAAGLRGVWLSALKVFDMLTNLLSKPNAYTSAYSQTSTGYWPTGEYQVYKYYNLNMTGQRIGTLPSSDKTTDLYATLDSTNRLKLLYGSRGQVNASSITINGLSSIGLPASGTLHLSVYSFPFPNAHDGDVEAPVYIGTGTQTYSGNSATFPVRPTDSVTAYAFEIQGTT